MDTHTSDAFETSDYVRTMRLTLPSRTEASLATPATGSPVMGLVVATDIFGLRPLFDDLAQRLADDWTMAVCVIEPFPGHPELTDELPPRQALMSQMSDDDHLRDALEAADTTGCDRVAMIGFCMGGMFTLKASRSDRWHRLASFYGMIHIPDGWEGPAVADPLGHLAHGHPERVMAFVGGQDPFTPAADIDELEAAGVTVVRYPEAEHGFAHDANRPSHRPADAADAFARAHTWLTT